MNDEPKATTYTCDSEGHHWVSRGVQSRFLSWVGTCSICGRHDEKDIDHQVEASIAAQWTRESFCCLVERSRFGHWVEVFSGSPSECNIAILALRSAYPGDMFRQVRRTTIEEVLT